MKLTRQEREYWRLVKLATARHCRENDLEPLRKTDADALRYRWHAMARLPQSHTKFSNHDYSVIFAWLREYIRAGELAANMLDLEAMRVASIRKSCFWTINKFCGLNYWEPYARERMIAAKLIEYKWEAVDWLKIPTEILRDVARTANNRARMKLHRRGAESAEAVPSPRPQRLGGELEPAPF